MNSITRTCTVCKVEKNIDSFKKDIRYDGGHIWQCKSCRNKRGAELKRKNYKYTEEKSAKRKKYYSEHAIEARKNAKDWRINNPERASKLYKDYAEKNIKKISDRQIKWRNENKKYLQDYRKSHQDQRKIYEWNRRSKKLGNSDSGVTEEQWEQIKKDYCYRCAYCGKKAKLTLDHIIPLHKNGKHEIDNCAPACQSCNSRKGIKSLIVFLLYRLSIY